MREIKFRAWDKRHKQMSDIFTLSQLTQFEHIFETKFRKLARFKDLIWLEFTGLKDKNGKEIYEGDIVQLAGYNNCQKKWLPTYRCEVKFTLEHGGYSVSTPYTDNHFNDFEAKYCRVIGNIYENPELLEVEE